MCLRAGIRVDPSAVAAWALAFVLVTYLAMHDGGYDTVVYSEAGIVVWWIVLLSALAGILPTRFGTAGWIAVGLLGAFAAWTGIATGWSESAGNTVVELGRVAAYLGVLVLAVALQGRTAARHTIGGLACAIGLVTVLAVLSRLHPQAFPPSSHLQFLSSESVRKLSYPLNYWNALAAFAAMGVPLLVAEAIGARTVFGRALAAAILPLSALCLYLTISRGGVLELGVGIAVFLLLVPRRLEAIATLLVSGAAAAILLRVTSQRSALTSGVPTHLAIHQGTQVLALALALCVGVALLQVAITRAARRIERPGRLVPSRRTMAKLSLALAVGALAVAIAAGVPGKLDHAWHDFKQTPSVALAPSNNNAIFSRLEAATSNGRYQYWQSAVHANATSPWLGIGPGTFEYWWARHATTDGYVRNAHSLYLETLAETGIIGLALLGGMVLCIVAVAARRSLSEPADLRLWIASASGALAACLLAAAVEWVWQLAAIAAAALMLGAVIITGRGDAPAHGIAPPGRPTAVRAGLAALALAAIAAIAVPFAGTVAVRASQTAAAAGHLEAAFRDSVAAEQLQPYAAAPRLQTALVLEAAGELGPAATAARAATTRAPTDAMTWLTLARIDARRGAVTAALAELRRARELDPRSTLFALR